MKLSALIATLDGETAKVALANIAAILGSSYDWNGDTLQAIGEETARVADAAGWPVIGDQTDDVVDMWNTVDWSA